MRPPICAVCGRANFDDGVPGDDEPDFGTVEFVDYAPLPDRRTGHPRGLEWFCPDHIEAARGLAQLTAHVAIRTLAKVEEPSGTEDDS